MLADPSLSTIPLSTDRSLLATDGSLLARIERIVRCRTGGRIRDLRVELQDGDVVLSGSASTYYAKQLATHAALDELLHGRLMNSIEVQ